MKFWNTLYYALITIESVFFYVATLKKSSTWRQNIYNEYFSIQTCALHIFYRQVGNFYKVASHSKKNTSNKKFKVLLHHNFLFHPSQANRLHGVMWMWSFLWHLIYLYMFPNPFHMLLIIYLKVMSIVLIVVPVLVTD